MILENLKDIIMAIAVMSIPILALIGWLILAIVRMVGRQRMEELASRERMAAMNRAVDPSIWPAAGNR